METENIRLLDDGTIINKTVENIKKISLLNIPNKIKFINEEFLHYLNGPCLYLNNLIYLKLGDNFILRDGSRISLSNKEEVLEELKRVKNLGVVTGTDNKVISLKEFKFIYKHLHTTMQPLVLLNTILKYIESYIMIFKHNEANIVMNDLMGVSDILLVEPIARDYGLIDSYLASLFPDMPKKLFDQIADLAYDLQTEILKTLGNNVTNSITLRTESNVIKIVEYDTPSARRYKINCEIIKENLGDYDDT